MSTRRNNGPTYKWFEEHGDNQLLKQFLQHRILPWKDKNGILNQFPKSLNN